MYILRRNMHTETNLYSSSNSVSSSAQILGLIIYDMFVFHDWRVASLHVCTLQCIHAVSQKRMLRWIFDNFGRNVSRKVGN